MGLNNFSVLFIRFLSRNFQAIIKLSILVCFIHYAAFENEILIFPQIAKFVKSALSMNLQTSSLETALINILMMAIVMIIITKLPVNGMAEIVAVSLIFFL